MWRLYIYPCLYQTDDILKRTPFYVRLHPGGTYARMYVLSNNRIRDAPCPPCRRWWHGELSNDKPRGRRWRQGCQLAQYYPRCVQRHCVIALAMRQKIMLPMYKLLSHGRLHGSQCPMSVEGRQLNL